MTHPYRFLLTPPDEHTRTWVRAPRLPAPLRSQCRPPWPCESPPTDCLQRGCGRCARMEARTRGTHVRGPGKGRGEDRAGSRRGFGKKSGLEERKRRERRPRLSHLFQPFSLRFLPISFSPRTPIPSPLSPHTLPTLHGPLTSAPSPSASAQSPSHLPSAHPSSPGSPAAPGPQPRPRPGRNPAQMERRAGHRCHCCRDCCCHCHCCHWAPPGVPPSPACPRRPESPPPRHARLGVEGKKKSEGVRETGNQRKGQGERA